MSMTLSSGRRICARSISKAHGRCDSRSAFFSGFEAWYSHYKGNFRYKAQWTPVVVAPLLVAASVGRQGISVLRRPGCQPFQPWPCWMVRWVSAITREEFYAARRIKDALIQYSPRTPHFRATAVRGSRLYWPFSERVEEREEMKRQEDEAVQSTGAAENRSARCLSPDTILTSVRWRNRNSGTRKRARWF